MSYIVISPSTILENYDMEDIMTMVEANSDAQSLWRRCPHSKGPEE